MFNTVVNRLYNAYVNGTLNPMNCEQCAVGNIFNNTDNWVDYMYLQPYVWYNYMTSHGLYYTPLEITNIERLYMHGLKNSYEGYNKEMTESCKAGQNRPEHLNLKGLLMVIDYLGELHSVEVPDIKELFSEKRLPELV